MTNYQDKVNTYVKTYCEAQAKICKDSKIMNCDNPFNKKICSIKKKIYKDNLGAYVNNLPLLTPKPTTAQLEKAYESVCKDFEKDCAPIFQKCCPKKAISGKVISGGAIAGIVYGVIGFSIFLFFFLFIFLSKRKLKK